MHQTNVNFDANPYDKLPDIDEFYGKVPDDMWFSCTEKDSVEQHLDVREHKTDLHLGNRHPAPKDKIETRKEVTKNLNQSTRRKDTQDTDENANNNNSYNDQNQMGRKNPRKRNQNLNYLQVLYTNADSIINKRHKLQERVSSEKPNVVVITEVNPKNQRYNTTKHELAMDGYTLFTNAETKGVRGVAIYIKNHLNPVEPRIVKTLGVQEAIAVEIKLRGSDKQLIMAVYRSPNSPSDNNSKLNDMIQELHLSSYSHILLLGDFNYPELEWSSGGSVGSYSQSTTSFIDAVNDSFLYQHVEFPTRHRPNQTPNILDLIFTNEESIVEQVTERAPLGKSDHVVINIKLRCYIEVADIVSTRHQYEKVDFDKMNKSLTCDWDTLFRNRSTEERWHIFLEKMKQATEQHVPVKKHTPSKIGRPLWLNRGTIRSIRRKHKAWTKLQESRTDEASKKYARARNQSRWATRKAVREFEKSVAMNTKTNQKLFWKYVHSKTKTRQPVSNLYMENGTFTKTDHEKTQVLNKFFTSVFTKEDLTNILSIDSQEGIKELDTFQITEEEVQKKLNKLKPSKSPGPDGLHPRLLKELAPSLSHPLSILFQSLLNEGVFPRDWLVAHVSPIYKKGAKTEAGNYRPVSLTSVLCKVMEGCVRDQVVEHMMENDLFSPHQHGFMAGRSSVTQLLETIEFWSQSLDEGIGVDIAYLDFQKAFDSVPHQRLLKKILSYRITGKIYSWIEAFLSHRQQRTVVNGAESDWAEVTSGIPQGSVLGPVLFTIYINGMPRETVCPIKLFADDAKIYHRVENTQDCQKIQEDLEKLQDWAKRWQLRFHPHKCTILQVGANHPDYRYYMTDGSTKVELSKSACEKDLGVYVDASLKFDYHISMIVKKANQMIGLLWRSFDYMDVIMFQTLYKTMIRSHLEYAAPVWSPHTWKLAEEIEKVPRRATKRVPGLRDLSYEQRLRKLKLPTLVYRRLRGDLINTYKYLMGEYDVDPCLPPLEKDRRTRGHDKKLKKMHCRTDKRRYFFTQRVGAWWNSLPQEVIDAPTINSFKSRLDNHFKDHPMVYDYKALDCPVNPQKTANHV